MQTQPKKLLVRLPNWVGDVVMATPVLDCLRQNYPSAEITGLMRSYVRNVVEDGPWFDRIIDCNDKNTKGFRKVTLAIRDLSPEIAILLPNSIRSALTVWLGGVKAIYGYRRSGRSLLLTGGPKPFRSGGQILPIPMVDYYMEICRWLGLNIQDVIKPSLFISESTHKKGEQLLNSYGIEPDDMVIGMNPGAKFGSSKCWPAEYFAELAELLTKRFDCKILLFTGPGEGDIARSVIETSKASIINTFTDKVDLALLKPLVKRCQLLITNDTGPRHYAVALDVPLVVIMGPIDPRYTASNLEKTIVLRRELDCSPCHKKSCPYDHDCMRGILPEEAFQESEKLLT